MFYNLYLIIYIWMFYIIGHIKMIKTLKALIKYVYRQKHG